MHSIAVFLLRRMCASGKAHREGDEGLSSDKDTENIIRYFNLSLVNYNCYIFTGKVPYDVTTGLENRVRVSW